MNIHPLGTTPRGATPWRAREMATAVDRRRLIISRICRGAHGSAPPLKAAIQTFIDAHQANPNRFIWTKTADEILARIALFAQRTADTRAAQHLARATGTGR